MCCRRLGPAPLGACGSIVDEGKEAVELQIGPSINLTRGGALKVHLGP
jgi:hypothetical protein